MIHLLLPRRKLFEPEDMTEFVSPQFSKRQVVEAGKFLKERFSEASEEAVEAFKIAHNWRACHIIPMRHLRMELSGKVRSIGGEALTAARLKRMASIRAKLRRGHHTMYQMQDIAGCRAILPDQFSVDRLWELFQSNPRHKFIDQDDYITSPRQTGYRSRHLIYRYEGKNEFESLNSNPQFVEIQLRTRLQHAWATAVEAVGMVRGEELKSGAGNEDWLRFFALMASEIAAEEGGVVVPGTPASDSDRRKEIVALSRGLDALKSLEGYRNAVKVSESTSTASPYYLIQFDRRTNQVAVKGVSAKASATTMDEAEGNNSINSVLVAVDKVGDLRAAYPNYFMDVGIFTDKLSTVLKPKSKFRSIDASWLADWIRGRSN
jgi:ppGpp synthetase/RelA/SpoT-type nucleotidyltranferase